MPTSSRLFFVFLLLLVPLAAQDVEGTVTDPQGSAVSGATVTLQSRDHRSIYARTTGPDGRFEFRQVPAGDYLLQVEVPGFAAAVREVQSNARLAVKLSLAGVNEQITVTATGGAQPADEVAHAVSVIDAEELAVRQRDRLADVMWDVPGLRIQQTSGPGSFTKLVFRGLRTTNTSVLLDGMPVRDAAGFRGDLASFFAELNPNNISAIEVVRGAGSALYGSAATGGVINFVPREATSATRIDFGYEGGSLSQAIGRFNVAGGLGDKFGYSLGVIRTDVNAGVDGDDVWRNTNASGHARYRIRRDVTLTANVYLSDTPRLNLNLSPFPIGPAGNELGYETGKGPVVGFVPDLNDPDDYRISRIFPASVRFDHRLGSIYSYSVAYRAVFSRRNFPSGPGQDPLAARLGVIPSVADISRFDGDDHVLETRHNIEIGGRDLLSVGYEYERQAATQEFASGSFRTPATTDRQGSHAVFFHNQLGLFGRRLQLGLGGRVQKFQVDNPESIPDLKGLRTPSAKTGDAALSYFLPRSRTKLRVHGGNSFREPSLSERFQVLTLSGQRVRVGNPLIEPERSVTIDGGLDQFLWNDRFQIAATYFYNRLQSLIQSRTLFQQTNVRGGLSRGVELELRARPARYLMVRLAYTYVNSDFIPAFDVRRADASIAPGAIGRRQEDIPAHTYSFAATARRGHWDGFFDMSGISDYDTPLFSPVRFAQILFRFDGFVRANIGAGYTRSIAEGWNMRWFGRVENVFNNPYFEDGFRAPRAVALVGVRFSR